MTNPAFHITDLKRHGARGWDWHYADEHESRDFWTSTNGDGLYTERLHTPGGRQIAGIANVPWSHSPQTKGAMYSKLRRYYTKRMNG